MKRTTSIFHALAAVALLALPLPGAAREAVAQQSSPSSSAFVVIVAETSPLNSVKRDQLSKLFLKKTTTLPNGRQAMPVDLDGRSKARSAFTSAVHRKSIVAITNYWQQQIFAGKEVPPPALAAEKDVVAFVRDNPDAVGYVSPTAELGRGIKVLQLED